MAKRTYTRRGRQQAKTPIRNDGRGRKQRQKAAQIERKTGSKDRLTRGRGVTRTSTGAPRGAQGPRTAPQQGPERAVKGLIGSRGASRSKPPIPKPPKAPRRFTDKPQVQANVKALQSSPAGRLIRGGRAGLALSIAQTAKGVLDSRKDKPKPKKPMANMGKNYKKKEKELSRKASASNFDRAFAAARKAGKKSFIWRGKTYTTKMKKS